MSRYTVDGGSALDARIDADLAAIRDQLLSALPERELDALALGGGYGRGEGGVAAGPDGPAPYNDYDLVLAHRVRDGGLLRRALAEIHRVQSARCGVHVDVTPIARGRIARLPPALTWYEFGVGYRVVWGDGEVFAPLRARRLEEVHASEWGRLLTNRGVGLVLGRRVLAGEPCAALGAEDPAAFVERQLRKGWLAHGDVRLADLGLYRPLVRERREALARALAAEPWAPRWLEAADFKLRPTPPRPRAEQAADLAELGPLVASALSTRRSSPPRPLVALASTLRHVPPRAWLACPPWRYPRERLRLAVIAELDGRMADSLRVCGSQAGLEKLSARFG